MWLERIARDNLPARWKRRIRRVAAVPPVGAARLGASRRLTPVSRNWGLERGSPLDRFYIERFLSSHASDIRGQVLEIGERIYTRQFGSSKVTSSDILDPDPGHPEATVTGDLGAPGSLSRASWDCIICTQVLSVIYDTQAAVENLVRALNPGGSLLMTLPGIGALAHPDSEIWGDYWRFTPSGALDMCAKVLPVESIHVEGHGNALVAAGFLHGLAQRELKPHEMTTPDERFSIVVSVHATNDRAA